MPEAFTTLAIAFEFSLLAGGAILLWRLVLRPAARQRRGDPVLPPWGLQASDFLLFICLLCSAMFGLALGTNALVKMAGLTGTTATIASGAAGQLGLLLGVGIFHFILGHKLTVPVPGGPGPFISGVATFLIAMPILLVVSLVWRAFLKLCGLPTESQDLVGMFARADSPALLAVMIALAVLIAPIAEELVFRAGLFRFARTRLPRALALLAPAAFFAVLHGNYASFGPLVALAVVFSLAYERTGRIGTTIVAHALFNLNTIMVIFSGIDTLN